MGARIISSSQCHLDGRTQSPVRAVWNVKGDMLRWVKRPKIQAARGRKEKLQT